MCGPRLRPAVRLHLAQPPDRGDGPQAARRRAVDRARGSRPRRRGRRSTRQAVAPIRDAFEEQVEAQSTALFATGRLWDDGIIDPRDTRTVLGMALSAVHTGARAGRRRLRRLPDVRAMTDTAIRRLLVANRGEIAARIFRTAATLGIATVAVLLRRRRATRRTSPMADEAVRLAGASPPRRTSTATLILAAAARVGRRRDPSRATASCPRTPTSPRPCVDAGLIWVGPTPESIEAMGSRSRPSGSRPRRACRSCPGVELPTADGRRRCVDARVQVGYPLLVKASRRRRRQGHAAWCDDADELAEAVARRAPRGRSRVRRRHGVPRALPRRRRATSRSRSSATRTATCVHLGRARVLDPAAPPEDHRGGAVAGRRRRRCARAMGEAAVAPGHGDRLRRRGHRRVPGAGEGDGPGVLLPRDEHPPAGRAPGHRGGHRLDLVRAAAARSPRASRCRSRQAELSVAGHAIEVAPLRRGPGQRLPAGDRAARRCASSPWRAGVRASTPASAPGRRGHVATTTRCSPRSIAHAATRAEAAAALARGLDAPARSRGLDHEPGLAGRDPAVARASSPATPPPHFLDEHPEVLDPRRSSRHDLDRARAGRRRLGRAGAERPGACVRPDRLAQRARAAAAGRRAGRPAGERARSRYVAAAPDGTAARRAGRRAAVAGTVARRRARRSIGGGRRRRAAGDRRDRRGRARCSTLTDVGARPRWTADACRSVLPRFADALGRRGAAARRRRPRCPARHAVHVEAGRRGRRPGRRWWCSRR